MSNLAIIGAGIVGCATGKGLSQYGHKITFIDTSRTVSNKLSCEGFEVAEIDKLETIDFETSILCLPSPIKDGNVDLSYFSQTLPYIGRKIASAHSYHLVILRSTIPPGTTEQLIIPELESSSNKTAGQDFGVCFNPEFLREATSLADFTNPWSIVLGSLDSKTEDSVLALYKEIIKTKHPEVITTDIRTAEMIKYAQNIYNAVKISFANEIWKVSKALNIDGNTVMKAVSKSAEGMWNPQYGIKGGYPFSGSCLPKDTESFLSFAKNNLEIDMPLLEAAIKINHEMRSGENLS